ncbi:MAG: hypothetical protein JKX84_11445 [Flavobacteriales bacterium]|nr:hypothetical protein [Flavobacteriales bacterium]
MRFKKYSSIDNTYQQDLVEKITEQGFADRQYVVQEKVHGANLSMATNGLQIVCAKRTELLTEQEDFFNFQTIASAHRKRLLAVHTELSSRYGVRHITVFGELFGGGYPHPKTPSEENA